MERIQVPEITPMITSKFYNSDGLILVPKEIRDRMGVDNNNFDKFEIRWIVKNNKIEVEIWR